MFFTLKSKDKEQTTWMQTRFKATSNKHKGRTVEITHQSHNSITIQHFSSAKASGSKSTIPKKHQKNANAKCQKNSNKITIAKKQQMQTAKKQQKNSKQLIHWISNLWLVKNLIRQADTVRTLTVQLSEELKKAADSGFGWQKKEGFWMGLHLSNSYQNPQFIPELRNQSSKMSRSTLVERGWGSRTKRKRSRNCATLCGDRACRVREMQARVRFATCARNPLRRSCMSSARNAGESAGRPVRAQPSAEIVRVECAKCRRGCDSSGARGHEQSKVLTFVAVEGNDPEAFGFKIEDKQRIPRPSQSDLEELEIPKAPTDEDFEEFSGIPAQAFKDL